MAAQHRFIFRDSSLTILTLWFLWALPISALSTLSVNLFGDASCKFASVLNPNITIPLNTCILSPGAWGYIAPTTLCDDGNVVRFLTYYSSACGGGNYNSYSGTYCNNNFQSPMPGFVAYCGAKEQLKITATTKFPAATDFISATAAAATGGSTTSATSQTSEATSTSSSSDSSSHGWSGLSNGERIGAIIALAIGIPSVLAAIITVYLMCVRRH